MLACDSVVVRSRGSVSRARAGTSSGWVSAVLPRVRVRPRVLSLSFERRVPLACHHDLTLAVDGVAAHVIERWCRDEGRDLGILEPRTDSVTAVQRFGSDLAWNVPHYPCLYADGVYDVLGAFTPRDCPTSSSPSARPEAGSRGVPMLATGDCDRTAAHSPRRACSVLHEHSARPRTWAVWRAVPCGTRPATRRGMTSHVPTIRTAFVSTFLLATGCADRSAPPPRSGPELGLLSPTASPRATDRLRAELTWYDAALGQVVRLRDGRVEPVQDVVLRDDLEGEEPDALRVFDDGSLAVTTREALHLYPMGGMHTVVDLDALDMGGIDGASIDDLWVSISASGSLPGTTSTNAACHLARGAIDRCVGFPDTRGYVSPLALGPDGAVYATDHETLYRYDGSTVSEVARFEGGVRSFHRAGGSLLALTYSSGAVVLEGSTARRLTDEDHLTDIVGTAEDFYYATYEAESVKINPGCQDAWFDPCDRRDLWTQRVIWHVVGTQRTEAGHENCTDQDRSRCDLFVQGMGFDGDRVVVLGSRLRAVATSPTGI
jgi:hypothetical protein